MLCTQAAAFFLLKRYSENSQEIFVNGKLESSSSSQVKTFRQLSSIEDVLVCIELIICFYY